MTDPTERTVPRRLWRMAAPIIVANITVPLLHATDTAVVGHMPEPWAIGGVALGAVIYTYVHASFNFLRMGTTGLTAQAAGAAREGSADATTGGWGEVRLMAVRALSLAGLIGLTVVLLQDAVIGIGLALLHGSAEVKAATAEYLGIRLWSTPASLAMFAVIGWFYALEDARVPLLLQLLSNGLNIALDLLFVLQFGWGVWGVGLATVIAEYTAIAVALWLVWRRMGMLPRGEGRTRLFDPARIRRLVAVNRDIFVRTVALITSFAIFMSFSARLGDVQLAANQVLYQFMMITAYGLDGFAHAAEALVGETYGRRRRRALVQAVRTALLAGGVVAFCFSAFWFLAGPLVIDVLTGIPEVREAARAYLPWAAALPLISVWAFLLDGIFLGATQNATIRNAMLTSLALYLGLLWLVFPDLGNTGLWIAITGMFAFRTATLALGWPRLVRGLDRAEVATSGRA